MIEITDKLYNCILMLSQYRIVSNSIHAIKHYSTTALLDTLTYFLTTTQKEIRFGKSTHSNIPIVNLPSHIVYVYI